MKTGKALWYQSRAGIRDLIQSPQLDLDQAAATSFVTQFIIRFDLQMGQLSVRLSKEIEREPDREAESRGRNRSDVVREAVGEYLTRKERDDFGEGPMTTLTPEEMAAVEKSLRAVQGLL